MESKSPVASKSPISKGVLPQLNSDRSSKRYDTNNDLPINSHRTNNDYQGQIKPPPRSTKRKHLRRIIDEAQELTNHVQLENLKKPKQKKNWRFAYDMYCKEILAGH